MFSLGVRMSQQIGDRSLEYPILIRPISKWYESEIEELRGGYDLKGLNDV
jgi:hypothetical protein